MFSLSSVADAACSGLVGCECLLAGRAWKHTRPLLRECADAFREILESAVLHNGLVYFKDGAVAYGIREVLNKPRMRGFWVARYIAAHTRRLYLAADGGEVGERRLVQTRDFLVAYHQWLCAHVEHMQSRSL